MLDSSDVASTNAKRRELGDAWMVEFDTNPKEFHKEGFLYSSLSELSYLYNTQQLLFLRPYNTPYSRHGHDEQKARLGRQICTSVRKS